MKLFLWIGVANDWGEGRIFVLAEELGQARKLALAKLKEFYLEKLFLEENELHEDSKYVSDTTFIKETAPTVFETEVAIVVKGSM